MKDYYKILGVSQSATDEEIKKAYRTLAKRYHPDANPNDGTAADKFADINEAHTILTDAQARAVYDGRLRGRTSGVRTQQRRSRNTVVHNAGSRAGATPPPPTFMAFSNQAEFEAQVNAYVKYQAQVAATVAYKNGYNRGAAEMRATAERNMSAVNARLKTLADTDAKSRAKLTEVERDRRDLEAELFMRDRELTLEKMRVKELEAQLIKERSTIGFTNDRRLAESNTALKEMLESANKRVRWAESDKSKLEVTVKHLTEEKSELAERVSELEKRIVELEENEERRHRAPFVPTQQSVQAYIDKVKSDSKKSVAMLFGALGVMPWVREEELKAGYEKVTRLFKNDAAKLARARTAYATLSDPIKRAEYFKKIKLTETRLRNEREQYADLEPALIEYREREGDEEFWAFYDEMFFKALVGDADAQNEIGEIYYVGEEVERDLDFAVFWFKEAVKKKHPDAMYNLGVCYVNGEGVEKNNVVGLGYIRQAEIRTN